MWKWSVRRIVQRSSRKFIWEKDWIEVRARETEFQIQFSAPLIKILQDLFFQVARV